MNITINIRSVYNYCFKRHLCISSIYLTKFKELSDVDINYLCDPDNETEILDNIKRRNSAGDIKLVQSLKTKLETTSTGDNNYNSILSNFCAEINKIPNKTHPIVLTYKDEPKIVKWVGQKRKFECQPKEFHEITKCLRLVRTDQLGNVSGSRSYFLLGDMADLEDALVQYSLKRLLNSSFQLVSVPDILSRDIIEACGMNTRGLRNQVYTLDLNDSANLCLSGTSEMALAGLHMNKTLCESELPLKLAAVSRCYRAETSGVSEEKGIFRVHEFTKVEMFVVTTPEQSDSTLEEIRAVQEDIFSNLGLHFKVLDMPPNELGSPAYRKYDIEAWLPGRNLYGEISSCSNCTDYQSRRLGIRYKGIDGNVSYVHSVNGTACAIPRMLIALIETYQNDNGTVTVPEALQGYMRGKKCIGIQKRIPDLKLIKNKK